MSKCIDLDKAGECLRNIVDNNRCGFCEKLSNIYLRCIYGHIACKECSEKEEGCLTCYTTFNSPVPNSAWVEDKLQPQKAKNAEHLLNTFQDIFKIDVYRRQRYSDQLKAEKELFPDCIQAPVKYSNKRKSINTFSNKENSQESYYPGENTSPLQKSKMEKSKYIQQWLERSENESPRKPLATLNVNNQRILRAQFKDKNKPAFKSNTVKNYVRYKPKCLTKKLRNKKTSISLNLNKTSLESLVKTPNKSIGSQRSSVKDHLQQEKPSKTNKQDDSGIVMDDECIVIEDTQTEIIDKDELALRAVHEAEKNEYSDYTSLRDDVDAQCNNKNKINVPYIKMSYLYASCPHCNKGGQNQTDIQGKQISNISITIEYGNKDEEKYKQSISVQTNISDIKESYDTVTSSIKNDIVEHDKFSTHKSSSLDDKVEIRSQDLFMDDVVTLRSTNQDSSGNVFGNVDQMTPDVVSFKKKDFLIIEESDTDAEAEHLQVAAEVHRACMPRDYDILTELPLADMQNRRRRAKRGATPGSTDSSEKENFDPNRAKRPKCTKKGKKKSNKS